MDLTKESCTYAAMTNVDLSDNNKYLSFLLL